MNLEETMPNPEAREGHLITEDETQQIAARFLATHRFLGDIVWDEIVRSTDRKGPFRTDSEALRPKDLQPLGSNPMDAAVDRLASVYDGRDLTEGEFVTWRVRFTDPVADGHNLTHRSVLRGVQRCVYDGQHEMVSRTVADWVTQPPEFRDIQALPDWAVSHICQRTLFDGTPYGSHAAVTQDPPADLDDPAETETADA